jgi:hypothetical protein
MENEDLADRTSYTLPLILHDRPFDAGTRSTNQFFLTTFSRRDLKMFCAAIEHDEAIGDVRGVNKPCVPRLRVASLAPSTSWDARQPWVGSLQGRADLSPASFRQPSVPRC